MAFSGWNGCFSCWHQLCIKVGTMECKKFVSVLQMKEALKKQTGAANPVKITMKNGETSHVYIRGFADQQTNILLISNTHASIGLKILEVKDVFSLEYPEGTKILEGSRILHAKWLKKILMLF